MVHTGRDPKSPIKIIETIEGIADLEHTVLAHIGRTVFDFDTLLQIADSGCYLEYDMFGEESSWYPFDLKVEIPNDAKRISILKRLIDEGYLNQILISRQNFNFVLGGSALTFFLPKPKRKIKPARTIKNKAAVIPALFFKTM